MRLLISYRCATLCRPSTRVVREGILDQEEVVADPRALQRRAASKENREEQANMLHKAEELKWVVLWILVTVFVFAIFIPTVNRALNL